MLHYHGTPITPRETLLGLGGAHFCVSHAAPRDLTFALKHGQAVMGDCGAYSAWTRGHVPDWAAYYRWVEPWLGGPHWAVVPDVIRGREEDNLRLAAQWPFPKARGAVVWHLDESLDHLARIADGWPRIAFGSAGAYRLIGTDMWKRRIDEAWKLLLRMGVDPWVHMLRAMTAASEGGWPFASADSTNVARNHKARSRGAAGMIREIDAGNPPPRYRPPVAQGALFAC